MSLDANKIQVFTDSEFYNISFEVPIIVSIFHDSMMLRRE